MEEKNAIESQTYKALANRARMEILHLLYKRPMSVEEIAEEIKLQPITVRHHLRALEEAGLITQKEYRVGKAGRPSVKYEISREIPPISFPKRQYLALSSFFIKTANLLLGEKKAAEFFKKVGFEMGSHAIKRIETKYEIKEWTPETFKEFFIEKYLREIGSEPEIIEISNTKIVYRLHNCIFFELALDKPDILCDILHESFNKGVSSGLGGKAKFIRTRCLTHGEPYCEHVCEWSI
ncbi:MAG: helix-turn-helix domain-containing protein [Candidatus Bathyarchaeia archaeon]|nr:helix-turn-helix domain-containing protein [Candidatus Bathyarchaeota archaeon]